MSGASSIWWTDATWNPVRGCSRVSEGCRNCYAENVAARFSGPGRPFEGFARHVITDAAPGEEKRDARWTGKVELIPSALDWPLRKRKPLRIFVNSMSDLFHEKLSFLSIAAVFGVMLLAKQHTFQILTKRPERARKFFEWIGESPLFVGDSPANSKRLGGGPAHACLSILGALTPPELAKGPLFTAVLLGGSQPKPGAPIEHEWPLPNVWLGVSVEDQATADERIPHLLATQAEKRFVSYEPALGPVDFSDLPAASGIGRGLDALSNAGVDPGALIPYRLDWIIVGGESGPGARPFDIAWARSTVEQCRAAGVACFVKQLGARPLGLGTDLRPMRVSDHPSCQDDTFPLRLADSKGGDWSEWPEDLRVREFPR